MAKPTASQYKVPAKVSISPIMVKGLNAMKMKYKESNVRVGSSGSEIGIEPYSIAVQYLIALEVIPFGVIRIMGDPKTRKTTMIQTIVREGMEMRQFNQTRAEDDYIHGQGMIIATEGKWSASKQRGVMGPFSEAVSIVHAKVFEEWQEHATFMLNTWRKLYDAHRKALCKRKQDRKPADVEAAAQIITPLFLGIDSFTGAQTRKIQGDVQTEGSGSKTFQDRAMIFKQWLETHAPNLIGYPICVLGTSHQSAPIDANGGFGPPKKKAVGGETGNYMCSLTLDTKLGYDKECGCHPDALLVQWQTTMSSLGVDGRKIQIEHFETYDEEGKPVMYFNFDSALTSLLYNLKVSEKDKEMGARVVDALGGQFTQYAVSGKGKFYGCALLGTKNAAQAVEEGLDATEFGRRLQTDPDIRAILKKALRIQPGTIWSPELAAVKDPGVIELPEEEEAE